MLRLQLPKWHKRNSFFTKLFVISCITHSIFCALLFFSYSNRTLFIVSHQKIPLSLAKVQLVSFAVQKKSSTLPQKTGQSPVIKKRMTGLGVAIKKQPVQKNKQVKKTVIPAVTKTIQKKKTEKITQEIDKKVSQDIPKKIISQEASVVAKAHDHQKKTETEEVLHVTQKEYDALQAEQDLQKALAKVWTPPLGITAHVESHVQVTIDWQGALIQQNVIKKTQIALFDVAVQESLQQVKVPKQFWGKQLTLVFKT